MHSSELGNPAPASALTLHPTGTQKFMQIVILGFLNALTPFSIDLYLPAFPAIARELGSDVGRVSLSVSVYFIGFAFGQIFYGPLLDRFGRKPPIYAGLLIYLAASIGCMTAHSVETLMIFRFLSALGGCGASVGATAMVRDFFPAAESAKIFSMLMLVLSASPLLAPTVGSLLVDTTGWRSLFGVLSLFAVIDLALVAFALPAPYRPNPAVSLNFMPVARNFLGVLKVTHFWAYTLAGSLSFAGLFVYVAASPGIFMDGFGVGPKTFGLVFAVLACGMIGGGQLNHLLVRKYGSERTFRTALRTQVAIAAAFLAAVLALRLGLVPTTAFLFGILVCAGVTYPNAVALALAPFTTNIGSASALLGFLQLGIGSLAAAITGLIGSKGILPTAAVMAVCSALGLALLRAVAFPAASRE